MATKRDYKTWGTGLPEESEALEDLDDFCEEMGNITRAEATRFILIAWSKARRGKFQQMWGFASGNPTQQVSVSMDQLPPSAKETAAKKRNGNGTAAAKTLDLDEWPR